MYEDIFPIWTYSYFFCLLLLGLLSEYIGYKSAVMLGVLGNIITIIILVSTNNFFLLQFEQVTVGLGSGSLVIFGSFLYHSVPEAYYQKVRVKLIQFL